MTTRTYIRSTLGFVCLDAHARDRLDDSTPSRVVSFGRNAGYLSIFLLARTGLWFADCRIGGDCLLGLRVALAQDLVQDDRAEGGDADCA